MIKGSLQKFFFDICHHRLGVKVFFVKPFETMFFLGDQKKGLGRKLAFFLLHNNPETVFGVTQKVNKITFYYLSPEGGVKDV